MTVRDMTVPHRRVPHRRTSRPGLLVAFVLAGTAAGHAQSLDSRPLDSRPLDSRPLDSRPPEVRSPEMRSLDWQPVSARDRTALAHAITVGAEEQLPLFACRASVGSGIHPGRFRSDFNGCHIGYGNQELSVMPFEVLTSPWQDDADGGIPPNSLVAGQRVLVGPAPVASAPIGPAPIGPAPIGSAPIGSAPAGLLQAGLSQSGPLQSGLPRRFDLLALFPCRAVFQGSVQVGEVAANDRGCSFGFGGRQVIEPKYQVLWRAPWMTWSAGIAHQVAGGAVVAGIEGGEPFYVCRAADRFGLHPGKIKQSAPGCSIASDGHELVATRFALLVPRWLPGNAGTIPLAALPAGQDRHEPLFLCRTQVRSTLQIGRIADHLASCRVGMGGGEAVSQAYDVLSEE